MNFFIRSPHLRPIFLHTLATVSGLMCLPALAADDAAQLAQGKLLFTTAAPACAVCHTLKDAGAEGAVGPVLDELKPVSSRVTKALRDGLGSMPSYKGKLTEEQIAALAYYVSRATGAEK